MKFLTCYGCKSKFPENDLIKYSTRGGTFYNYCSECYKEKKEKERFSEFVCSLFGLKLPGAKIYSQRKRLIEAGYTDDTIIVTLDYLYNVCKTDKKIAGLGLVTPENISKAKEYFRKLEAKEQRMIEAVNKQEIHTKYVSNGEAKREEKKKKKIDLNSLTEEW